MTAQDLNNGLREIFRLRNFFYLAVSLNSSSNPRLNLLTVYKTVSNFVSEIIS